MTAFPFLRISDPLYTNSWPTKKQIRAIPLTVCSGPFLWLLKSGRKAVGIDRIPLVDTCGIYKSISQAILPSVHFLLVDANFEKCYNLTGKVE